MTYYVSHIDTFSLYLSNTFSHLALNLMTFTLSESVHNYLICFFFTLCFKSFYIRFSIFLYLYCILRESYNSILIPNSSKILNLFWKSDFSRVISPVRMGQRRMAAPGPLKRLTLSTTEIDGALSQRNPEHSTRRPHPAAGLSPAL